MVRRFCRFVLILLSLTGLSIIFVFNNHRLKTKTFYNSLVVLRSTQFPIILSNYLSELTSSNGIYSRHGTSGNFFYEAIQIRVNTTGSYTFKSSSTIANTYGYLYQGNFYPSYPSYNIVTQDDDSAGNNQFQLTATLRSDITYILVFTTYRAGDIGSFNILASGPDNVFDPTQARSQKFSKGGNEIF